MLRPQAGAGGVALAGAAKAPKLPQKPQGQAEEEEKSKAPLNLLQAGRSRFARGQQAAALIGALSEATEGRFNHPLGWCPWLTHQGVTYMHMAAITMYLSFEVMCSASNFTNMTPDLRSIIITNHVQAVCVGLQVLSCCPIAC